MARPTKRTKQTADKVVDFIRAGHTRDDAARLAGVSPSVLYAWAAQDEEFSERIKTADAEFIATQVQEIRTASSGGTWQAAAWLLERKYPDRFARRDPANEAALREQIRREMTAELQAEIDKLAPGVQKILADALNNTAAKVLPA